MRGGGILPPPIGEKIMRLTSYKTKTINIPGDDDMAFIIIKKLSLHAISQIEAKCSKIIVSSGDDSGMHINNTMREDLIAETCITGWGNFFDEKGEEVKFNAKNFKAIASQCEIRRPDNNKLVRFNEWVDYEHSLFTKEVEESELEVTGN